MKNWFIKNSEGIFISLTLMVLLFGFVAYLNLPDANDYYLTSQMAGQEGLEDVRIVEKKIERETEIEIPQLMEDIEISEVTGDKTKEITEYIFTCKELDWQNEENKYVNEKKLELIIDTEKQYMKFSYMHIDNLEETERMMTSFREDNSSLEFNKVTGNLTDWSGIFQYECEEAKRLIP